MASEQPPPADIPLAWVGFDEEQVVLVNQFLLQTQPDQSIVFGLGQAIAPPKLGDPDQVAQQVAQIEFIPVRTLARVAMTEVKLRELSAMLDAHLSKVDQARARLDPRNQA